MKCICEQEFTKVTNSVLTELLGISSLVVTGLAFRREKDKDVLHLMCAHRNNVAICPKCGAFTNSMQKEKKRSMRHLDIWGKKTFLHFLSRRFKCSICGKEFTEELDFVDQDRRQSLKRFLLLITTLFPLSYFPTKTQAYGNISLEITDAVSGKSGEGEAIITPSETTVGTYQDYKIYFQAGPAGISKGGYIRIDLPTWSTFHGLPERINWTRPQIDDSTQNGFVKVISDAKVYIDIESLEHSKTKNHRHQIIESSEPSIDKNRSYRVKITAASKIQPGALIDIHYRHARSQWIEQLAHFRIYTDANGDGECKPIKKNPTVKVTGGPARWIKVVIPSLLAVEENFDLKVAILDRVGFPARDYFGTITFKSSGPLKNLPESYTFKEKDNSVRIFPGVFFEKPGVFMVGVTDGLRNNNSNPSVVRSNPTSLRLYWGDLHWHSNLSDGLRSPKEGYQYAKNVTFLDFTSMTDHDSFLQKEDRWPKSCEIANRFYQPGKFLTFCAYEWTSSSAMEGGYGHINVYYPNDNGPLFPVSDPLTSSPDGLWMSLEGLDAITVPHHVASSSGAMDWTYHNEDFQSLVEIYSNHGNGEYHGDLPPLREGMVGHYVQDALSMGYKLGFIASTDSHYSLPGGNEYLSPINVGHAVPALVAVYASKLTRENLSNHLKRRHTYATTGKRILLWVLANDKFIMGDEFASLDPPKLHATVAAGNSIIDTIEIIRNNQTIHTVYPESRRFEINFTDNQYTNFPMGSTQFYYFRVTLKDTFSLNQQDTEYPHLAWSSPIWVKKGPPNE